MENRNAILNSNDISTDEIIEAFDLDELEEKLDDQLSEEFLELEFLEEEKKKIGNPDALGKVILDEIWTQFGNQIGLDMTNETLNQKYDREHQGESYDDIAKDIMKDSKYKKANKAMKEKQKLGKLQDEYTGKNIHRNDKANLDHVVSRKELYENARRRQAGISTKKLANKDENLKATNESLNKSKKEKSVDTYIANRKSRERDLIKQNERANKKIDESNMSDIEKRKSKEINNKRLQNKLDADDKRMKLHDKNARNAINKEILKGVATETAKKAGKDALKQMAVAALFSLLKEVMNGFIRFLKSKTISFSNFIKELKQSIKSFFKKISNILHVGATSALGTIVTEIFGPIVSLFKKIGSLIKVGISSLIDAIKYLKAKENRDKPFSIKVAQVGKIITAGLVAGGAIILGEVFEKLLLTVPGMQVELPLIGSLANVIGMFLASLLTGLVGAIVINLIDKFIAKKQKAYAQATIVEKGNAVIEKQHQIRIVNEVLLERDKGNAQSNIMGRHQEAANIMKNSYSNIMEDFVEDFTYKENINRKNNILIDSEEIATINKINSISDELDDLLE
ncbi:hypothetical protein [Gemella sanguinis]|uniref:hypothetical protein n=1 Tax=Gemella sanguinis TaxID=84135 RepID=UPI0028EB4362|nr:hypothetical protein [Gemella sanguinis]